MSGDGAPAPPPECKCEKGAPKWVVTFGDMMSLLLTFFVLLLSFSTTDVVKYEKLVGSVKEAFGVAVTSPVSTPPKGERVVKPQIILPKTFSALVAIRAKATRAQKSNSQIDMESGADWVRIRLEGDALFDEGAWAIKPEAAGLMADIAEIISSYNGDVSVEGHTDGIPPNSTVFEEGSYVGHYELGLMRAVSVVEYLAANFQIDESQLLPSSLGDTKPRETNELEEGRRRNRRVEFEFRTNDAGATSDVGGAVIR